jgi:hypothetical protein
MGNFLLTKHHVSSFLVELFYSCIENLRVIQPAALHLFVYFGKYIMKNCPGNRSVCKEMG